MKFTLALLLAIVIVLPTSAQTIEVKYDRARDESTILVDTGPMPQKGGGQQVNATFVVAAKGQHPTGKIGRVYLQFSTIGRTWRYLEYRDFALLADGIRHRGELTHDGEVLESGNVYESLMIALDLTTARQVAQGKDVLLSIASDEFTLTSVQKAALGRMVEIAEDPGTNLARYAGRPVTATPTPTTPEEKRQQAIALEYVAEWRKVKQGSLGKSQNEVARYKRRGHERIVRRLMEEYEVTEEQIGEYVRKYGGNW